MSKLFGHPRRRSFELWRGEDGWQTILRMNGAGVESVCDFQTLAHACLQTRCITSRASFPTLSSFGTP